MLATFIYLQKKEMFESDLYEYYRDYWKNNCDNYSSFTYGRFLFDMLNEGRIEEDCGLYGQLVLFVMGIVREEHWDRINQKLIADVMDLSELQEFAEDFIF